MHINFSDLLKIQKQLEDSQAVIDENLLIELVNAIRPSDPQNTDEIKQKKYRLSLKAYYAHLQHPSCYKLFITSN